MPLDYNSLMHARRSRDIFAILILLFAAASVALAVRGQVTHQSFKAFYCSGKAVAQRQDPYRVEPVRTCEHELAGPSMAKGSVEPAPLPGYGLAPFALLSTLPPILAAILFGLTVTLAVAASALAISRITGIDRNAVFLAFTPLAFLNVAYGEIPPYSLLGLCGAAYFLTREKYAAAAACVALSLIQPTLGFPAVLAVLLFVPRARPQMLVAIAVLVVISVAALGIEGNLEYFARVLPLQSESELAAADQYSLAHVLFTSGLSGTASLTLARIVFALATILSLVLARAAAHRTGRIAYIVLLPPAISLLFGLYVHDVEVLAAIPAALLLAVDARSRLGIAAAIICVALLCVVWSQHVGKTWIVLDFVAVCAAVYGVRPAQVKPYTAGLIAAATVICMFTVSHIAMPPRGAELAGTPVHATADEYAPSAWKEYIDGSPALVGARYAPAAPTWVGLTLLVFAAL